MLKNLEAKILEITEYLETRILILFPRGVVIHSFRIEEAKEVSRYIYPLTESSILDYSFNIVIGFTFNDKPLSVYTSCSIFAFGRYKEDIVRHLCFTVLELIIKELGNEENSSSKK